MKITSHQQFIEGLAQAAIILHDRGVIAPTAPEIAAERWPDEVGVAKFMLIEVRRRLGEVRRLLHELDYSVVPVSDSYYRLRHKPAITVAQVGECLAMGRGKSQTGILFVTEGDELAKWIKVRHETWSQGAGAGKTNAARERLGVAMEQGLLTQGEVLAITGEEPDEIEQ